MALKEILVEPNKILREKSVNVDVVKQRYSNING